MTYVGDSRKSGNRPEVDFWNQRYARREYVYGTAPNAFLAGQASLLDPGMRVLSIGDGEGRNSVWLAERGLSVTAVDISAAALRKTMALAFRRGVTVQTVEADLTAWDWPEGRFDLVVSVFLHLNPVERRAVHRAAVRALAPGGWLLLEAFSPAQMQYVSGGPPEPEMLYSTHMLHADFAELEISRLSEQIVTLTEGRGHCGPAATVRLVARRPSARS